MRRNREYDSFEAERKIEAVKEEEDGAASEDDLPELKDDDNESVVSIDVGFSQAFTSDPYLDQEDSEDEKALEYLPDSVVKKPELDTYIKAESPLPDEVEVDLLPVKDDSDNESIVSIDRGLTQVFTSSTDCKEEGEIDEMDDQSVEEDSGVPLLSNLSASEQLLGWQALCLATDRMVGETIWECRTLLKKRPYVNIVDYIDAARIGAKIEVFSDFREFSDYTRFTEGKCIPLKYAKQDPLLASLLQVLDRNSDSGGLEAVKHASSRRHRSIKSEQSRQHGRTSGQPRRHDRSTKARINPY